MFRTRLRRGALWILQSDHGRTWDLRLAFRYNGTGDVSFKKFLDLVRPGNEFSHLRTHYGLRGRYFCWRS